MPVSEQRVGADMQYPKLIESKTSANEVVNIEWNPSIDLLATVFGNDAVTCSRLLSLQKVWHKQSIGSIDSVAWRPDGKMVAIGTFNLLKSARSECFIYDVEDGKQVYSIQTNTRITSISWFQHPEEVPDPLTTRKIELLKGALDNLEGPFTHRLARDQAQLNVLVIATAGYEVSFYALGLLYLGSIDLRVGDISSTSSYVGKTHMSNCLKYLTCVRYINPSPLLSMKVFRLDTLHIKRNQILRVAKFFSKITDEMEYLDDTVSAIKSSWIDVLAGLDNKLSSYTSRRGAILNGSTQHDYTFIDKNHLLMLLVLGTTSDNLEKFLTDMSDKGLKKLNNSIEQTCQRLQNLIVKNAQKVCFHLHSDLNYLKAMGMWRSNFGKIGLGDKPFVEAMKAVGSLLIKFTELLQVIGHSLKSTQSFFKWLISVACRLNGEPSNVTANFMSHKNLQLIEDFIEENFDSIPESTGDASQSTSVLSRNSVNSRPTASNFTLEQVGQYLKNEPLTRPKYSFDKPNTNFWIDFLKCRPELVETKVDEDGWSRFMFYPHDPNSSLIQEYYKTKTLIDKAFRSVSDNLSEALRSSHDLIDLQEFAQVDPEKRVQIATDITKMRHHTLFRLCGQTTNVHLISQSLDNKTFSLIEIEFHIGSDSDTRAVTRTSTSQASSLVISDWDFYEDREAKKLKICFLLTYIPDQSSQYDTVMVLLELDKVLKLSGASDRPAKDLTRVLQNELTMRKECSKAIMKLDLYKEPPKDREHDPEGMMVKKVKKVEGRKMFASSARRIIAFTSSSDKRLHLYELDSTATDEDIVDDEPEVDGNTDESLIDTELFVD